uniref:Uncharacterized protein n=1 Tax=viral metagenome TaxID=1070528 RepID=A0A6M3L8G0_9ZZZZ
MKHYHAPRNARAIHPRAQRNGAEPFRFVSYGRTAREYRPLTRTAQRKADRSHAAAFPPVILQKRTLGTVS